MALKRLEMKEAEGYIIDPKGLVISSVGTILPIFIKGGEVTVKIVDTNYLMKKLLKDYFGLEDYDYPQYHHIKYLKKKKKWKTYFTTKDREVNNQMFNTEEEAALHVNELIIEHETSTIPNQVPIKEPVDKEEDEQFVVFISGSMSIRTLPTTVVNAIKGYLAHHIEVAFIVGDAPGVDTKIQNLLEWLELEENTTVCHVGKKPRNLVTDKFYTMEVETRKNLSPREYYTEKDNFMLNNADAAIMIHDGKSKGTQANIDKAENKGIPYSVH